LEWICEGALISIERSEAAWRLIAATTGELEVQTFADRLQALRQAVLGEFPRAMEFIRPGFDEPWR